jgi:hypothetical protein
MSGSVSFANAQDDSPIATDRPDQTESALVVPGKMLQLEAGFNFEETGGEEPGLVHPTILWRLGLNGKTELRMITDLTTRGDGDQRNTGMDPIALGLKTALWDEHGWIPKASLIAHLSFPTWASADRKLNYYFPDFRFTFLNVISDKLSLGYNVGAQWDGVSGEPVFLYTFAPALSLGGAWGCYAELYGFAPQYGKAEHNFDAGFTYLVNNNAQFDLSGGWSLTGKESIPYYVSLGFSWRFDVVKK